MRRRIEMKDPTRTTRNGQEHVITDRDKQKHLQFFRNGNWWHSEKCKDFTNKECATNIQPIPE